MALLDTFWEQVGRTVSERHGRKQVQTALRRLGEAKNKNTYTTWFGRGPRPNLRLSQVEDLARALQVQPATLFVGDGVLPPPAPHQLELPFEPGTPKTARLEIEAGPKSLIVRPAGK